MKNITCEDARERMSYYLDGILADEEILEFEAHLSICADCRKEVDQLSQLVGILNEIPEVPVPDRFELNFKRALHNEIAAQKTEKNTVKRWHWKSMSAVAAVMVIGVLSYGMLQNGLHFTINSDPLNEGQGADMAAGIPETTSLYGSAIDDSQDEAASIPEEPAGSAADSRPEAETAAKPQVKEKCVEVPVPAAGESDTPEVNSPAPFQSPAPAVAPRSVEEWKSGSPAAITDGSMSRGTGATLAKNDFEQVCQGWISKYVEAINTKDISLFKESIENAGKSGYTTNTAAEVLELYQDYLGDGDVTFTQLRNDTEKMQGSYLLEGNKNSLKVFMKTTTSGLIVKEALLDHGTWLKDQLQQEEFTLIACDIQMHGKQITFKVEMENSGETETDGLEEEQVKEIIWKKTE